MPALCREGTWYFCPGENGGALLKCSPETLVRLLEEDNTRERVLMRPLRGPFGEDAVGMEILSIISTPCGGRHYLDPLFGCRNLDDVHTRNNISVMVPNNTNWLAEI